MTAKKLVIVHAGMSETSSTAMLVGRIASAVAKAGVEHGVEIATRVVSVRELLPELPAALGSQHFGPGFSSAIDALREADALVVASPVYKAQPSGALNAFLQVLDDDLVQGLPTIVAATAGTKRHALVADTDMRALLTYMRALVVPTALFATADDWADGALPARVDRAAGELALLMQSGFAESVRGGASGRYRHDFGSARTEDSPIELDTDLMRIAAGGAPARKA